jgi:hypothetical protein
MLSLNKEGITIIKAPNVKTTKTTSIIIAASLLLMPLFTNIISKGLKEYAIINDIQIK